MRLGMDPRPMVPRRTGSRRFSDSVASSNYNPRATVWLNGYWNSGAVVRTEGVRFLGSIILANPCGRDHPGEMQGQSHFPCDRFLRRVVEDRKPFFFQPGIDMQDSIQITRIGSSKVNYV